MGGDEEVERVRTERVKCGWRAWRRGGPRLPVAWEGIREEVEGRGERGERGDVRRLGGRF